MPYGRGTTYEPPSTITFTNAWPNGSSVEKVDIGADIVSVKRHWSRTGKNALSMKDKVITPGGPWVLVEKLVPNGPKLSFKIYNAKIGKWIWARETVRVFKIQRLKNWKRPKGLDLPPNPLNYQETNVSRYGASSVTGTYPPDPNWFRKIEGPLYRCDISSSWGGNAFDDRPYYTGSVTCLDAIGPISDAALRKLYERIRDSDLSLGQMLAERKQTAAMAKELFSRLVSALIAIKRGRFMDAIRSVLPKGYTGLANDTLLFQYGIRPLMTDLQNIVEELQKPVRSKFTVRGVKKEVVDNHFIVRNYPAFNHSCKQTVVRRYEITVRWVGTYEIVNTLSHEADRYGLNLSSLPALAWELTPWSFVVDWLLPIGSYLQNIFALSDIRTVSLHRSILIREQCSGLYEYGGKDTNGYVWSSANAGWNSNKVYFNREVLQNTPPLPFPSFKNPISAGHAINSMALLTQLFSRGK